MLVGGAALTHPYKTPSAWSVSRRCVPELDRRVATRRGQRLAVGREEDPLDRVVVTPKGGALAAVGRVPDPEQSIDPTRGERQAVGGKSQPQNRPGLAFEGRHPLLALQVPDDDRAVGRHGQGP